MMALTIALARSALMTPPMLGALFEGFYAAANAWGRHASSAWRPRCLRSPGTRRSHLYLNRQVTDRWARIKGARLLTISVASIIVVGRGGPGEVNQHRGREHPRSCKRSKNERESMPQGSLGGPPG